MRTRKLFALVLTAMMLLALTLPVLAEGEYTITIKGDKVVENHTYEAYQVFKGDLAVQDDHKVLSNVEWGSGVDGAALLAALKADTTIGTDFAKCESAADVAEVIKNYQDDKEKIQAFAKVAGAHLVEGKGVESTWNEENKTYTISGLNPGYYLVKDKDNTAPKEDAYTRYILEVVGNVEVNAKVDVPTIDKKIDENGNKVNINEASIGDKIDYVVTSTVPDMTGYNKYYFVVNDTMSKGLTFNDDVTITIGDKTLAKDTDFTVTTGNDANGGTTIKIVFKNFIQYAGQKGDNIVIKYSATLNENAEIGTANLNEVDLVYSNNPNYDYKGENEPDDDEPKGQTPKSTTETFTTELTITKNDDKNQILTGAAFRLTGEGVNIVIVTGEVYTVAEDGTYYKLTNGTYTETAPDGNSNDKYDSTTIKYKKETQVKIEKGTSTTVNVEGFVDENGQLTFTGLGAGEYTLTEIVTPAGYNTIEPITFTVSFDSTTKKFSTNNPQITVGETNKLATTIVNNSGSTLPSTGGMGTTLFYVLGGLLAVGAGVLLATRKKMSAEK